MPDLPTPIPIDMADVLYLEHYAKRLRGAGVLKFDADVAGSTYEELMALAKRIRGEFSATGSQQFRRQEAQTLLQTGTMLVEAGLAESGPGVAPDAEEQALIKLACGRSLRWLSAALESRLGGRRGESSLAR